jgi:hypothetical protein
METGTLCMSEDETETSVTARRIAIFQAVLDTMDSPATMPHAQSVAPAAQVQPAAMPSTSAAGLLDTGQTNKPGPDPEEHGGHDLSPLLFSVNSSQHTQNRNESVACHVDSYVSFLDALDEDGSVPAIGQCTPAEYGSLHQCAMHSRNGTPSETNSRAGDVKTPSPPNPAGDGVSQHVSGGATSGSKPRTMVSSCRTCPPLGVFATLSAGDGACSSVQRQLSPRAVRVGGQS